MTGRIFIAEITGHSPQGDDIRNAPALLVGKLLLPVDLCLGRGLLALDDIDVVGYGLAQWVRFLFHKGCPVGPFGIGLLSPDTTETIFLWHGPLGLL